MSGKHAWLHEQVKKWVGDGLLEQAAADAITERYPVANAGGWLKFTITALGAVVFGLGVILAFAYNWAAMPKALKLVLIFAGLGLSHGIALFLGRHAVVNVSTGPEHGNSRVSMLFRFRSFLNHQMPNAIEGFHLLGSMLFGAGIFLIAQIYHLDEHYPTAFLLWGLGALALAWLMPSNFQALLALVALSIWGGSKQYDYGLAYWLSPLMIFAGIVVFSWLRRSSFLFSVSFAVTLWLSLSSIVFSSEPRHLLSVVYLTCIGLITLSLLTKRMDFSAGSQLLFKSGALIYGAYLYFNSSTQEFMRYLVKDESDAISWLDYSLLLAPVILCVGMLFYAIARKPQNKDSSVDNTSKHYFTAQCALLLVSSIVVFIVGVGIGFTKLEPFWLPWMLTAVLFAHGVLLVIQGNLLNSRSLLLYGAITVMVLVASRFLDLFDSLLARSLLFLFVGGLLFYIGHRINRLSSTGNNTSENGLA